MKSPISTDEAETGDETSTGEAETDDEAATDDTDIESETTTEETDEDEDEDDESASLPSCYECIYTQETDYESTPYYDKNICEEPLHVTADIVLKVADNDTLVVNSGPVGSFPVDEPYQGRIETIPGEGP